MQSQPSDSRPSSELKRARQAARSSDDVFKGGAGAVTRSGRLKSPWHLGASRLIDATRRQRPDAGSD